MNAEHKRIYSLLEGIGLSDRDISINPDMTVDVYDTTVINRPFRVNDLVKEGRLTIKFGTIHGSFIINRSGLTTLEGCPHTVDGNFWCRENFLTTLESGPTYVGYTYDCRSNLLRNLKGAPEKINYFDVSKNKLTSFEGIPKEVTGFLNVTDNDDLYDVRHLRDSNCQKILSNFSLDHYSPPCVALRSNFSDLQMFKESLDYNYLKFDEGEWKIIRFKWIEAHEEFGLEAPEEVLGYKMI